MRALRLLTAVVSLLVAVTARAAHEHAHPHTHEEALPPGSMPSASLYLLEQTWTDDGGAPRRLASFAGRPLVLAMVYTSCQAACPLIVADMKRLEAALPAAARERVQWLVVSFDPARDSVQRLKQYRAERKLDGKAWTLLRAGDDDVRDLAAALGFRWKRLANGDFQHSNLISIVDAQGVVRFQQTGIGQPLDGAVKALLGAP